MKISGVILLALLGLPAFGQVSNNEISNRITLSLNADWYASSTRNASVEWDCINKALTSTCLVYHNDQWFTIVPPETGTYFINIANQRCSNRQGVQIVVLEGDPCKVDSYQLKMCISYTDQSDMFVQIDSLIGGKEYLLNIDGYLGDQCEFDIKFSTTSQGIPIQARNMKAVELQLLPHDSIVTVQWNVPDSVLFRISGFSLYRKHEKEKKAKRVFSSSLERNAYGKTETVYTRDDTLRQKGKYVYSIYGNTVEDGVILLAQEQMYFKLKGRAAARLNFKAHIDYVAPKSGHVSVKVFDDTINRQLFSTTRRTDKGKNTLVLDLSDYVRDGVLVYRVVISDKTFSQEHFYRVRRMPK